MSSPFSFSAAFFTSRLADSAVEVPDQERSLLEMTACNLKARNLRHLGTEAA